MSLNFKSPDLTQHPPRSPRVRLGGYALLPRMLDKCRATLAGKNGDYSYNCPLDQELLNFLGLDPEALKREVATGKGDGELLEWIKAHSRHQRAAWEIAQWSAYQDTRSPEGDPEILEWFAETIGKLTATRKDVRTYAELLDLDDYVSFGGQA